MDFAGPLFVKSKTGEMFKAYIALFTCCVTRAVHLDLVTDLIKRKRKVVGMIVTKR